MQKAEKKPFVCVFSDAVLCSMREFDVVSVMDTCMRCAQYELLMLEAELEDERVMQEIEDIYEHGYR